MIVRGIPVYLFIWLLLYPQPAHSQASGPIGCWLGDDYVVADLGIAPDGSYWWGEETGQWLVEGAQIWLVADELIGTKWVYSVIDEELTLNRPEDFNYLGEGRYMYLQFTPPDTVWRFHRSTFATECGGDYADAVAAVGHGEPASLPVLVLDTQSLGSFELRFDDQGTPGLCLSGDSLCGTFDAREASFSADPTAESPWGFRIWNLDESVPAQRNRSDGSACEGADLSCDFGRGMLLLFYDGIGAPVSGRLDLGLDEGTYGGWAREAQVAMEVLWLTIVQDCGGQTGMCKQEFFVGVSPTPRDETDQSSVVFGPFRTGWVEESAEVGADGTSQLCRTIRRTQPMVNASEGLITVIHDFDLNGENAVSETYYFVSVHGYFDLTDSTIVPAPVLSRDCEPL